MPEVLVGLLLRQSPPHCALDTWFGWVQNPIYISMLSRICLCERVCVCACMYRGFLHSVFLPLCFIHTHLSFKGGCPIQVCLFRYFASPALPRAADQYLVWPHTTPSTLYNWSFLPCQVLEPLCTHTQLLIFLCVFARGYACTGEVLTYAMAELALCRGNSQAHTQTLEQVPANTAWGPYKALHPFAKNAV